MKKTLPPYADLVGFSHEGEKTSQNHAAALLLKLEDCTENHCQLQFFIE